MNILSFSFRTAPATDSTGVLFGLFHFLVGEVSLCCSWPENVNVLYKSAFLILER